MCEQGEGVAADDEITARVAPTLFGSVRALVLRLCLVLSVL